MRTLEEIAAELQVIARDTRQAWLVHSIDYVRGFPEEKLYGAYATQKLAMETAKKLNEKQAEIRAKNPQHQHVKYIVAGWALQTEYDKNLDK